MQLPLQLELLASANISRRPDQGRKTFAVAAQTKRLELAFCHSNRHLQLDRSSGTATVCLIRPTYLMQYRTRLELETEFEPTRVDAKL